jgi:hypothetical protein
LAAKPTHVSGKRLLSLKYENIKARIKTLVAEKRPAKKKAGAKKSMPPK